jgi:hypothetical protein
MRRRAHVRGCRLLQRSLPRATETEAAPTLVPPVRTSSPGMRWAVGPRAGARRQPERTTTQRPRWTWTVAATPWSEVPVVSPVALLGGGRPTAACRSQMAAHCRQRDERAPTASAALHSASPRRACALLRSAGHSIESSQFEPTGEKSTKLGRPGDASPRCQMARHGAAQVTGVVHRYAHAVQLV